jgi:hypothetical protein
MLNAERFKREPISCTIGPLFVLRRPLVLSLHWSVFLIYSAPMCALSVNALAITSKFPMYLCGKKKCTVHSRLAVIPIVNCKFCKS